MAIGADFFKSGFTDFLFGKIRNNAPSFSSAPAEGTLFRTLAIRAYPFFRGAERALMVVIPFCTLFFTCAGKNRNCGNGCQKTASLHGSGDLPPENAPFGTRNERSDISLSKASFYGITTTKYTLILLLLLILSFYISYFFEQYNVIKEAYSKKTYPGIHSTWKYRVP
jgi:hypothetical protein